MFFFQYQWSYHHFGLFVNLVCYYTSQYIVKLLSANIFRYKLHFYGLLFEVIPIW